MSRRYTIEEVEKIFKDNGCELLETEYINSKTPIEYRCNCGRISKIQLTHFLNGHRCKECGYKKIAKNQTHTFEYAKQFFDEQGCELLEKEYIGCFVKMRYICNCGDENKINFNHFQQGHRCEKCALEKRSGKNHPNYNHNLTDEERKNRRKRSKSPGSKVWRILIYKNNDYTCQKCTTRGGDLVAHHIESWDINEELRYIEDNGTTFCISCHHKFHSIYGYGNNTTLQLEEFLELTILV